MTSHPRRRLRDPSSDKRTGRRISGPSARTIIAGAIAATAISAFVNHRLARKAERDNPPFGRFLDVHGTSLHYIERGRGTPLVLLHGNGSMIQDFDSSGLIDLAASSHRVIAFDRPGYGHSDRPRSTIWTPGTQADLIHDALAQLGVRTAIVLGHSWGCSVAVALAQRYPDLVRGLVLASGYYYPTARVDVPVAGLPAVPVVGDVLRYAVAPIVARLAWPLMMRQIFGPQPVPEKFAGFPREMSCRPSQIRASAAEAVLMVPNAVAADGSYGRLAMPVSIVVGAEDRLIDPEAQSIRLNREIAQSKLHVLAGAGHMVQQTETAAVMAAIEEVSDAVDIRG